MYGIIARVQELEKEVTKLQTEVDGLNQELEGYVGTEGTLQTIESLLKAANAEVVRYVRFEMGEGLEKKNEDFAAEVAAQIKG